MAYHDGRSARPPPDASSSSSAGSSYIPLPRASDLGGGPDGYSSSSNAAATTGGGGGGGPSSVYSSGPYNNYPSSHSQQMRLPPHLPPQHQQQHQHQHQSSYPPSHASHQTQQHPHPHSSYHHPHAPHPPQQSSSSMPYGNYDYQPFPLFPYGYPPHVLGGFGPSSSASGQGQGNNAMNGGGGGGGHSQQAHHPSTGSTGHSNHGSVNEDTKPFQFYNSSSNIGGGQMSSNSGSGGGGGGQGSGGQDESNSVAMAPLPEHIEAGIMSTSTWLLHPGGLPLGLDVTSGSSSTGATAAAASASAQRPDNDRRSSNLSSGPGNVNSSPATSTQTIVQHASSQSNVSNSNNIAPSPISSNPALPSPSAPFGTYPASAGPAPLPAIVPPMAPPTDPLFLGLPQDGWRLAVEPLTFTSGLEGISGLPLDVFHATTAMSELPPPPATLDMRRPGDNLAHDEEVQRLDGYLADLITLMEPFAPSASNPSPNPPPPFLHTRITRLATLVSESLKLLEPRSQPLLDADFTLPPPGIEVSEADREMDAIRNRRQALNQKQKNNKNEILPIPRGSGLNVRPTAGPQFTNMNILAPRPPRDVWRCSGCGTTSSSEWRDGPDGPQSLCENCGYHYERLLRKRPAHGDPDFSSVPAFGHNPNLVGLGPT